MEDKKSHRMFSLPLYALAFFISLIIFGIGVYVGTLIDKNNLYIISNDVDQSLQRVESTQLLFFLDDTPSFCPVYKNELEKLESDTEKINQKLDLLADKGAVDIGLKKRYFILEAQSYFLSKRINSKCNLNDTMVLYFYSNKNCNRCIDQGADLLRARDLVINKLNKTIKLYSFDGDLGSDVADALKQKYYILEYPAIIVNEKTYRGYQNIENLSIILSK